jgi:hypothetical protein
VPPRRQRNCRSASLPARAATAHLNLLAPAFFLAQLGRQLFFLGLAQVGLLQQLLLQLGRRRKQVFVPAGNASAR